MRRAKQEPVDHMPPSDVRPCAHEAVRQLIISIFQDVADGIFSTIINRVGGSPLIPRAARIVLFRLLGIRISRAQIYPGVYFKTSRVSFGWDAMVNRGCSFDNVAPVTLGARVRVGSEVHFCTTTHEVGGPEMRAGARWDGAITVAGGTWIGARAVILPGVTIGEGCVIAAGAVVISDCEPNGLYAGVPARRKREIDGVTRLELVQEAA